jgi:hypothetical protein
VATIAYAVRLSYYLKRFKESRSDLEAIINTLSEHITTADKAVHNLHESIDESSLTLKQRTEKAQAMKDELELMVQTGDVLANRLEELAVRNRRILDGGDGDIMDLAKKTGKKNKNEAYDERLETIVRKVEMDDNMSSGASVFSIRDTEIERGDNFEGGFTLDDNEVLSDAERDLYNALARNKKTRGVL